MMKVFRSWLVLAWLAACLLPLQQAAFASDTFEAGAAVVDVSPVSFPVPINGGMTSRQANRIVTPVNARAIALQQGDVKIAVVVVDSCMLPRDLLDEAKQLASSKTGIPADSIMISATHTHTAPAAMSCLGTDADPDYRSFLRIKLAEAVESAQANLRPAESGWGSIRAENYTAIRRWIRRSDRIADDPFGNPTVHANMHAARNPDDVTGPSGPEDPDLSLIAFRSTEGRPIAVLANFSMHYYSGQQPVSADYFGLFSDDLGERLAGQGEDADDDVPAPVAMMSHGCSGDIWRRDYTGETPERFDSMSIEQYSKEMADLAEKALARIEYTRPESLDMAETRLPMKYRVPDKQRLEWARRVVAEMETPLPANVEQVYAREQIFLDEMQSTEIVVQAIRIGELAIATTPNETYALTGLKIKRQTPLPRTMVIELANGGDGYIPPPEQHHLGGYNTWPARSAGLEVTAEPKITEAALRMLEKVSGKSRRDAAADDGPAAKKILEADPLAYWRLEEMAGPWALDRSEHRRHATFEPGVVFYLDGPADAGFAADGETNRAAHFAGGRMRARLKELPPTYSVSIWIWNGMPTDGREVTGWFYARGADWAEPVNSEKLGIGGTDGDAGKLILQIGDKRIAGRTEMERWKWYHVVFIRNESELQVRLDGNAEPEIRVEHSDEPESWADELFFGGGGDSQFSFEGRLDEIAVFSGKHP